MNFNIFPNNFKCINLLLINIFSIKKYKLKTIYALNN